MLETAAVLDRITTRAAEAGDMGDDVLDDQVVALLDAASRT
ncbi:MULTISPECIES: hypothetical protein [Pseudonocardia]|nr:MULTISPECIES: hypothetical protein [Pseudonocardia]